MNILEDNRKIAVFMGLDHRIERHDIFYKPAWKPGIGGQAEGSLIYRPDKDWNQLMEVVERIESDSDTVVRITVNNCRIELMSDIWCGLPCRIDIDADTKIQAVYQSVLEYVKQKEVGNG